MQQTILFISQKKLPLLFMVVLARDGIGERTMQDINYTRMIKDLFAPFRQERVPELPEFWKIVIEAQVGLLGSGG